MDETHDQLVIDQLIIDNYYVYIFYLYKYYRTMRFTFVITFKFNRENQYFLANKNILYFHTTHCHEFDLISVF